MQHLNCYNREKEQGMCPIERVNTMEITATVERVRTLIKQIRESAVHTKLILVVAPHNSGKTKLLMKLSGASAIPRVNLNLELSKLLIDVPVKRRSSKADSFVSDIVKNSDSDGTGVILDNIEMLFAVELQIDPLRLFEKIGRNYLLIVSWPGKVQGKTLTYAEPGHGEYRHFTDIDCSVIDLLKDAIP